MRRIEIGITRNEAFPTWVLCQKDVHPEFYPEEDKIIIEIPSIFDKIYSWIRMTIYNLTGYDIKKEEEVK